MAQDTTIVVQPSWTQLSNADITNITFLNQGPSNISIVVQNGTSDPSDFSTSWDYAPGVGELDLLLTELVPGVTTPNRVFAFAHGDHARVRVSHA